VSILLGTNDVHLTLPPEATPAHRREQLAKSVAAFHDGLRSILERLHTDGIRCLLVTPGLYDETLVHPEAPPANRGLQATLIECGAVVRALAAEFAVPVIDWTRPLMDWNAQLSSWSRSTGPTNPCRTTSRSPRHRNVSGDGMLTEETRETCLRGQAGTPFQRTGEAAISQRIRDCLP